MRLVLLLFSFIPFLVSSQDHLEKYWSNVGCNKIYPKQSNRIDFKFFMDKSGQTADQVIAQIIADNRDGALIYFQSGSYNFQKKINLPSHFELQGESTKSTKLVFQLEPKSDAIVAQGIKVNIDVLLKWTPRMGDSILLCPPLDLNSGDWITIRDNDTRFMTSGWGSGKSGQIAQIKNIIGDSLIINGYVKRDYEGMVVASKLEMVENVKVTNLSIVNNTQTDHHTSNIRFSYANNCSVYGINSDRANYAHVLIEYSANCQVQKSLFERAHSYGNGGAGYGVVLQFTSGECLIKENQFKTLRHAILLQAGVSGNKIELNHSTDPFWEGVFLPKHSAGDIVLHGNYPYLNLITQNTCQNLVIDNSHGLNGPNNVFRLNLIESYGLIMNRKSAESPQYFIQNKITGKGLLKGKFRIKGKGHVLNQNQVKGKIID